MTYDELVRESKERYESGTGPWSKKEDLDQVDLVRLEELASGYGACSDARGLLSGCVRRLVAEVRRAKEWPKPPKSEKRWR